MQIGYERGDLPGHGAASSGSDLFRHDRHTARGHGRLLGHLAWIATRVADAAGIFLAVIAAFGDVALPLGDPRLPGRRADRSGFRGPDDRLQLQARRTTVPSRASTDSASSRCSCSRGPSSRSPSSRHGCRTSPVRTPLYHGVALCRELVLGTPRLCRRPRACRLSLAMLVVGVLCGRSDLSGGGSCQ